MLQKPGRNGGQSLYVLAYHRVIEPDSQMPGLDMVSATPAQFDAQMQLLAREYHPVTAEDVLNAFDRGTPLPRYAVLVTVDDGYRDFQDTIFPIASRYGIRPVLFVPTQFMGQGYFWWDRLPLALSSARVNEIDTPVGRFSLRTATGQTQALARLSDYVRVQPFEQARQWVEDLCNEIAPDLPDSGHATLDWGELRALARAGVDIASHTHSHPILSHVSLEQARREIRLSQDLIAREIGRVLPIFAFPDGRHHAMNQALLPVLQSEGFRLAFTRIEGRARLDRDEPLQLPRLGVSLPMSLAQFHLHLTPLYDIWKNRRLGL
ncbi:MAG: polysaccharide deacetylase family protein [Chloroflexota bacterium]